ncbi:MAG: glycine cleavage system aminomethyltransferase GcvT [Myxococcota bacterium]
MATESTAPTTPSETRKRTPLYETHVALGARMVPFSGYDMPVQYDGMLAEHHRVRQAVGLFDVSHMGEVRVRGKDALTAVNRLITNDLHRIADGRALYTCMCADDGTIVDDLIIYRLAPDHIFICVNAGNHDGDVAHMRERLPTFGLDASMADESADYAQIAVQGPKAPTLLARIFGEKLAAMKPFRMRTARFGGAEILYATTGYTGEPGAELYVPNAVAAELWKALVDAGPDLGVGPAGLGARDTLRLEMGMALYGNDIDRTTTPLEANLGWVTRLDKDDFIGKAALVAQESAGVPRRLVGIELTARGILRHGYAVLAGGANVGAVTSGTLSPSTGKAIALAYVQAPHAALGTTLEVDIRGKATPAVVVEPPSTVPPAPSARTGLTSSKVRFPCRSVPSDLRYTKDHEWARQDGDLVVVGITDYAQEHLGDVVMVELPSVGAKVETGKPFGTVESPKSVSDLYAPVSGTVAKVNKALDDAPDAINKSPYGDGWIVAIAVQASAPDALAGLLDAAAYTAHLAALDQG